MFKLGWVDCYWVDCCLGTDLGWVEHHLSVQLFTIRIGVSQFQLGLESLAWFRIKPEFVPYFQSEDQSTHCFGTHCVKWNQTSICRRLRSAKDKPLIVLDWRFQTTSLCETNQQFGFRWELRSRLVTLFACGESICSFETPWLNVNHQFVLTIRIRSIGSSLTNHSLVLTVWDHFVPLNQTTVRSSSIGRRQTTPECLDSSRRGNEYDYCFSGNVLVLSSLVSLRRLVFGLSPSYLSGVNLTSIT